MTFYEQQYKMWKEIYIRSFMIELGSKGKLLNEDQTLNWVGIQELAKKQLAFNEERDA